MKKEKQKETSTVNPNAKKRGHKGLTLLILAIITGLIGAGLFVCYFLTTNILFGYIFIPPAGISVFLFFRYAKAKEQVQETIYTSDIIPKEQVNSMNIYPLELGGVKFENSAKPEGQPRRCLNDGKAYFIHIWDTVKHRLVPFMLPDTVYYDPRVYAERVLSLPAHRRIFVRKQTMFQKLSPFFLLILIIALWIANITITKNPGT